MRPINKIAALGLTSGGSTIDREERSQPVAFGRPTLHLNQPVTVPRRTKVKYIRAKLSERAEARLFEKIMDEVTVRDEQNNRQLPANGQAAAKAREMVIDALAEIVGPHQIAAISKHPPFEKLLERLIEELRWLPPAPSGENSPLPASTTDFDI